MTEPLLYDKAPPNSVAFVLAWLLPLVDSPLKVGSKRWATGGPLPYRMVNRITGSDDLITDYPVISVHTFAATETDAQREADKTHRRMLLLADDPLLDITMADASLANCEWLETLEGPHPEPYSAESVVTRLVARYQLGLHFTDV